MAQENSPYGNLTELNTERLILDSIGAQTLESIALNYLNLLGTSSAIYEKNGDYALGIFSSGWCRHLDEASRFLSGTDDNRQALASGKWLCHESCWTQCSRVAIEAGKPVDIECNGGIHLYAVPIFAGEEVVGAINMGYSDPPTDPEKIAALAALYKTDADQLMKLAQAYETRPPEIIAAAKHSLSTSASLIGAIIEAGLLNKNLQQSESSLRSLYDDSPISLWEEDFSEVKKVFDDLKRQGVKDLDAYLAQNPDLLPRLASLVKIVDVNQTTLRIFEAPSKSAFFKALPELFCDDTYRDYQKELISLFNGATAFEVETTNKTMTGRVLNAQLKAQVAPGCEDTLSRVFVSIIDISERKKSEQALIESSRLNQQIINCAQDGIIVYGPDLRYQVWSPGMEKITGLPADKVLGKYPLEIFPFMEKTGVMKRLEKSLAGEEQPIIELEYFVPETGASGWTANLSSPLRNAQGRVIGVIGMVREITEQKKAENDLAVFRNLMEQSNDAIYISNNETRRFLDVNEKACSQLGYSREELLNMQVTDVEQTFITRNNWNARMEESRQIKQKLFESTNLRKDGSTFPVEVSARMIQTPEAGYIVAIARDITERKKAEAEKEKLRQQLIQAQKMESIGILAGGVAHDFNNLLGIIMGSTQLVEYDTPPNSETAEELKVILDAARRAKSLTMKLLTFARKKSPEKAPCFAAEIISDVIGLLKRTISKSIAIKHEVDDSIVLNCDANQIHQALLNICTNSADAMPMGGELLIECGATSFNNLACNSCPKELNGNYCLIQISDTGTGISEDMLPKIIEPFFTTKGVGKGTGLGLSVTHGIVMSHDGHMHAYSELGKGTCIKIFLPMEDGGVEAQQEKQKEAPVTGTETILVVDDEKAMLRMAGRVLERKGYTPLLANRGIEAVDIYRRRAHEIAAVVLDLMMPEMDGADVYRELREINPDVRVVFSSGYSLKGHVNKLLRDKQHRFVQKPFDVEVLCRTIRELIDNHSPIE